MNTNSKRFPSQYLILKKPSKLPLQIRQAIVDLVAQVLETDPLGRSDLCIYSAILIADILREIGLKAKILLGKATYYSEDRKDKFSWKHSWVVFENETIDGNVDSMRDNPKVPKNIMPKNYWGPTKNLPEDRIFEEKDEIDEKWILNNTSYKALQNKRKAALALLPEVFKIENYIK